MNFKCPIACPNENRQCKYFIETAIISKMNFTRRWNRPSRTYCLPVPSHNHLPKDGKEEYMSFIDTVSAVQYNEKEFGEDQMDMHRDITTINDGKLDTDWRDNNIDAQCTKNSP